MRAARRSRPQSFLVTVEDLSVFGNQHVGIELFIELYGRADLSQKALGTMTQIDGGYCLDAPTLIPAGGCRCWEVPGDPDELWLPEQITIDRWTSNEEF